MKAVYVSEGTLSVKEMPEPEAPGALVNIAAASICGSDLRTLSTRYTGILGHEISGVLDDGRRVAVEPWNSCGVCDQCQRGNFSRCRMGLRKTVIQGGFAERIIVPEKSLVELPPGLPVRDASLVEPLAVAIHVVNKIAPQPGQHIAIIGAGSVGMLCLAVARKRGCDVTVFARHDFQMQAAEKLGASGKQLPEYDAVIETGGSDSSVVDAVNLAGPGGTVYLMGINRTTLPFAIYAKELTLVASTAYCCTSRTGREMEVAAQFLAAHPIVAETLITHRLPLEDSVEAFRIAKAKAERCFKVIIEP